MSDMLDYLYSIIKDRQENPREGSYTNKLFEAGEDKIVQKVGEEAVEVVIAAKGQGRERLVEEIADLTYHTLVLMAHAGLSPDDISAELKRRHQPDQ
jgi:phosphoribosyl-ATP pyrophosphohydrolase